MALIEFSSSVIKFQKLSTWLANLSFLKTEIVKLFSNCWEQYPVKSGLVDQSHLQEHSQEGEACPLGLLQHWGPGEKVGEGRMGGVRLGNVILAF